jgi:DNA-directed RNA polymerase subunit RPC12/RpoP
MYKRKPISTRTRFEVFKRDGYLCQYCGDHPPQTILHVDHIVPVKDGGSNDLENLITSCITCNLGKSSNHLTNVPMSLKERGKEIEEREKQLKGYNKILLDKAERIEQQTWIVVAALVNNSMVDSYNRTRLISIKRFVELLPVTEVIEAADITLAKWGSAYKDRAFKYFCAICWRKIREQGGNR